MLSKRYITAYDFQNRLVQMFPDAYAKQSSFVGGQCFKGLAIFGFNSPATGKPISQVPNSETVKTIQNCYGEAFSSTDVYISSLKREKYIKFFSQFIPETTLLKKFPSDSALLVSHMSSIQSLTSEEQDQLIAQTVETMLGIDEVILSYGTIKDVKAYRAFLKKKMQMNQSVFEVIKTLTTELALRNEFLTY
jgi:hypothetical protein